MDWTRIERVGLLMAVFGLVLETLADEQKRRWHAMHINSRPTKESRETPVCSTGSWGYSRHPNYFGEIMFQFGIFFICFDAIPLGIIVCPILVSLMLLVFDGALLTQEQYRNHRYLLYPSYLHYKQSVSLLVPCPRFLYQLFGPLARKMCCFQWGCYDEVVVPQSEV
jgi:steroid 5-alpha reductase family enzyme